MIGISAGSNIGDSLGTPYYPNGWPPPVPASSPSPIEPDRTLLSYTRFPVGPFANVGITAIVFARDIPRYRYADYSAAVATVSPSRKWYIYKSWRILQAYSPASGTIATFPRSSTSSSQILCNGDEIVKYVFVIVSAGEPKNDTGDIQNGTRPYQTRIHPADFYPSAIDAQHRTNRSYILENFHFYCLVGKISTQVYGAGTMYVNFTKGTIVGLDTRSAHSFVSFDDQDQAVAEAALDFLGRLGYDTSDMRLVNEMWMWAMDNMDGMV